MSKLRLTKSCIEKLPFCESGNKFYLDDTLPGFGLRVGKTAKSFYAEMRVGKKSVRVTIGKWPQVTPKTARKDAQVLLSEMAQGRNPNEKKKVESTQIITFGRLFTDYMEAHRLKHKPRTVENYRRAMRVAFADWIPLEIQTITSEMVVDRHIRLGDEQGACQANTHMRMVRALFNFAKVLYRNGAKKPLFAENPVDRLGELDRWYEEKPKTRVLKDHQLREWFEAVNELERPMVRDFFLFLLFTGLRKLEAAKLKWSDVDFQGKTVHIVDTKNGKPLTLPMTSFTFALLQGRKDKSGGGGYVFPSPGKVGFFVNPSEYCKQVAQKCGIEFSVHDLRRTFTTIAARLVTVYEIKALVNHSPGRDVTAGYIISDVENLRKPSQKITDALFRLCQGGRGKVIPLPVGKKMHKF